jgi:hypothetical protein
MNELIHRILVYYLSTIDKTSTIETLFYYKYRYARAVKYTV